MNMYDHLTVFINIVFELEVIEVKIYDEDKMCI